MVDTNLRYTWFVQSGLMSEQNALDLRLDMSPVQNLIGKILLHRLFVPSYLSLERDDRGLPQYTKSSRRDSDMSLYGMESAHLHQIQEQNDPLQRLGMNSGHILVGKFHSNKLFVLSHLQY
jgi:hypothetical protein